LLLCAIGLLSAYAFAYGQEGASNQKLYLLAATPAENVSYATNKYPTTLYRVSSAKKLDVVREITSEKQDAAAVQAAGNAIFVLDLPNFTVHVIHTDDPIKADSVTFNTDRKAITIDVQGGLVASVEQGSAPHILLPMVMPRGNSPPTITLVNVSSSSVGTAPRVQFDKWQEYASLRFEGTPGIPIMTLPFNVSANDTNVVFRDFPDPDHFPTQNPRTVIDKAPPASLRTREVGFHLEASNDQYLVLRNPSAGTLIHDRVHDTWKRITIEGDQSRLRLFGEWLATDVEVNSSGPFGVDKPEKSGERDSRTNRLPSVYGEYGSYCSLNRRSFPGVLVLQNLADDRTIRIETHQEDSEILWASGDEVLYRVNDEIYRSQITGGQMRNSSLVVKGDDVSEVHWVFFAE
jgi:hypothetical protein